VTQLLPAPDTGFGFVGLPHDCVGADAVGAQQHDGRTVDMLLRRIAIPGDGLEPVAVRGDDRDANSGAHAPDSHASGSKGIPIRSLLSGRDHQAATFPHRPERLRDSASVVGPIGLR
jgi:hypothetical protein